MTSTGLLVADWVEAGIAHMIPFMMNMGLVPLPLNADLTAYWTMWGTIATAAVTALLVIFACLAWIAAMKTLRGQKKDAEVTALRDYMHDLLELSRLSYTTPEHLLPQDYSGKDRPFRMMRGIGTYRPYVESVVDPVRTSGNIWRAYHFGSRHFGSEFLDAERALLDGHEWRHNPPEGTEEFVLDQFRLNSSFAKQLAEFAGHWQVSEKGRRKIIRDLQGSRLRFILASPCSPDEARPIEVEHSSEPV